MTKINKLKKLMLEHELTARQVGDLTSRQYQTVRAWLCGVRNIPDEALQALKQVTQVRK